MAITWYNIINRHFSSRIKRFKNSVSVPVDVQDGQRVPISLLRPGSMWEIDTLEHTVGRRKVVQLLRAKLRPLISYVKLG